MTATAEPQITVATPLDPQEMAQRLLESSAQLSRDPQILAAVQAAVDRGNCALSRVEQIKRFTLLAEEWLDKVWG